MAGLIPLVLGAALVAFARLCALCQVQVAPWFRHRRGRFYPMLRRGYRAVGVALMIAGALELMIGA